MCFVHSVTNCLISITDPPPRPGHIYHPHTNYNSPREQILNQAPAGEGKAVSSRMSDTTFHQYWHNCSSCSEMLHRAQNTFSHSPHVGVNVPCWGKAGQIKTLPFLSNSTGNCTGSCSAGIFPFALTAAPALADTQVLQGRWYGHRRT